MTIFRDFGSAFILLNFAAAAAAQQPPMPLKWDTTSRSITIDENMPYMCDNPFIAARDTFNAVEPNFQIYSGWGAFSTGPGSTLSHFQKGYGGTVPVATTVTAYRSAQYYWESYGTLVDADIEVNHDLIYWPNTTDQMRAYDIHCDISVQGGMTQWNADYQSAILHELGHLVGMSHRTDSSTGPCVMHSTQPRGTYRRVFCADEKTTIQTAY